MRTAILLVFLFASLLALPPISATEPRVESYDVVIYGGTSAGVVAAVQTARMGKSAVVVEPGHHLGGLTSGGLGATDIGNKNVIGGIAREFYGRVFSHYADDAAWKWQARESYAGAFRLDTETTILSHEAATLNQPPRLDRDTMWTFEPHVAEEIYREMLSEVGVIARFGQRLRLKSGVTKDGPHIAALEMENGTVYRGKMFIDASYEGDLLATAGVSYTVGREANAAYAETLNGVQTAKAIHHQFIVPIDPYVRPGDSSSGLLRGIQPTPPGPDGSGDAGVQAYCFRMCQTDAAENRVPWPKPDGYDEADFELLLRNLESGDVRVPLSVISMPNRKSDTNNNRGFSTDFIGASYDWPEGDYVTRERIFEEHKRYQMGLMWTLANHPRVPQSIRDAVSRWGLARDEFVESGNWPHQLYVREARRMVSAYVMTQHHCQGCQVAEDSVGMAAYGMDSHNVHRYARDGRVFNEGDVQVGNFAPYPISFRATVPRRDEADNLAVPVCLSASHIAFGSIRMEPVFMVLGQSAATTACLAIDAGTAMQDVDYATLRARLLTDRQVLAWAPPPRRMPIDPQALSGVVGDNADEDAVSLQGQWTRSTNASKYVGTEYLHDGNAAKGEKQAVFALKAPRDGRYRVVLGFPPGSNRATNVPVTVRWPEHVENVAVNQRLTKAANQGTYSEYRWERIAEVELRTGAVCRVVVENRETDGYVVVDALRLEPTEP